MNSFNKILIVAPGWIGDMVMAHSLIQLLKQQDVNCQIDVLAMPGMVPVASAMAEVNEVILSPFKHGQLDLVKRFKLGKQLRSRHYDQAIILRNNLKSAIVPWQAKIPLRTSWLGEKRWGLINDIRHIEGKRSITTVEKYALLAGRAGAPITKHIPRPKLSVDLASCQATLDKFKLNLDKPILALCPGAEFGIAKRWPPEYYAAVANTMELQAWQVWIFGGPNDQATGEQLEQHLDHPCVNLIGRTHLNEAIELLAQSQAVVSNDSGLMHLSLALSKPVVIPFGATDCGFPREMQPQAYPLSLGLDCSPCFKRECPLQHHKCMLDLKPDLVLKTLDSLT